jgi:hypothetical protein
VAAVRNTKVGTLLASVLSSALKGMEADLVADAARYDAEHAPKPSKLDLMSVEELEAYAARQLAQIDALKAMVAAKRSAAPQEGAAA